jgi:hypothetical protein
MPGDVAKELITARFVEALREAVLEHDADCEPEESIRIRLSLHAGDAIEGEGEWAGRPVIAVCRLVDSALIKRVLAAAALGSIMENAPDLELSLLAVGERADERPETPLEPDGCGQVAGAGAKLPVAAGREHRPQVARPDAEHREVEVVLHAETGEEARLLVGTPHPELRARTGRELRDLLAVELDRARARWEVAGDHVEERRLAGAVRAEDRAPLAVRDIQVDVAHGVEAAEPPADPPQAEDRLDVIGYFRLGHRAISR